MLFRTVKIERIGSKKQGWMARLTSKARSRGSALPQSLLLPAIHQAPSRLELLSK